GRTAAGAGRWPAPRPSPLQGPHGSNAALEQAAARSITRSAASAASARRARKVTPNRGGMAGNDMAVSPDGLAEGPPLAGGTLQRHYSGPGANWHLVPRSRNGALVRPTIDAGGSGRRGHTRCAISPS